MVDMAHIAGLVAAGLHQSPVPYADVVTTTTHKTLRGPRGGLILCREALAKQIDKAIFPGTQGGPLEHIIAGKAVCFGEALKPEFKEYQKKVVENAAYLAQCLTKEGFDLVGGGTDNHLLLLDLRSMNITGKELERRLDEVYITVNKNAIPDDPQKPFVTSGIRVGTPYVTSRGFGREEMEKIARWIYLAATDFEMPPIRFGLKSTRSVPNSRCTNKRRNSMKAKKFSRIFLWCGIAAFLFAVGFVWYALNHPEHGTPFGFRWPEPGSLWDVPFRNRPAVCVGGCVPEKRTVALNLLVLPAGMPAGRICFRIGTKVLLIAAKICYNKKSRQSRQRGICYGGTTGGSNPSGQPGRRGGTGSPAGSRRRPAADGGFGAYHQYDFLRAFRRGKNDSSENHRSKNRKTLHKLNGTSASVSDIKEIINGLGTFEAIGGVLLYLDEIQYLNKKQQQSLLEFIENGQIALIASTTENPYFYVYNAILSRSTVFEFKPVDAADIEVAVRRAFSILEREQQTPLDLEDGVVEAIALGCGGDVRKSINAVEMCVLSAPVQDGRRSIGMDAVRQVSQRSAMRYDRDGDAHYDILSPFTSRCAAQTRMRRCIIWPGSWSPGISSPPAGGFCASPAKISAWPGPRPSLL